MPKINVFLVKSFTKDKAQGSPAGVILDADGLSDEQMQAIAAKLDFAETAFVQSSERADYRLRFFAPNQEVNLCGHATIATFHMLLEQGLLSLDGYPSKLVMQETRAGNLDVCCHSDGQIVMHQTEPEFGETDSDRKHIAKLLNIAANDLMDLPLQIVSTGTPKLMIPIKSLTALRSIKPDLEGIKAYCHNKPAKGFYPFTPDTPVAESDFFARQFNPLADKNEDPVTGVAAGALGCYATECELTTNPNLVVAQGHDLGMGGTMYVDVADGVKVGGYAVSYGTEQLTI